jgi:molybdate transport system substrate-binding protein
MISILRALLCLAIGITVALPASAANLRVLCPNALRAPVLELARTFVRSSAHKIEFIFASAGAIHKRVATGESADVVIGTARGVGALVGLGRAIEGSDATIAQTVLALATHRAVPAPSIAPGEALAQTLRAAASLVLPDPSRAAPGGVQAVELLERLGLAAEVKAKTQLVADSATVIKHVATGAAAIGIAAMSDLVGAQDVVVTGPLIDPSTAGVVYTVALVRRAASAETGRAFIGHLASTEAKAVFRTAGFAAAD